MAFFTRTRIDILDKFPINVFKGLELEQTKNLVDFVENARVDIIDKFTAPILRS